MSYYFNGPWGDYASGGVTAGGSSATTVVLRPRISVKDQTYSKGYDGSIQANASGITSAIGGVGVVTGGEMTIACWTLPVSTATFGTVLSVSYEPNITTSTTAVYEYVELGWFRSTISTLATRPRMRSRRGGSTTPVFGPANIGIGTVGGLTANTWVHMAGVVNVVAAAPANRTIQLYVNGSTGTISGSIAAAETLVPAPFNRTTIGGTKVVSTSSGGAAGCENNYNGYVAECAIWNTVLTAAEIKSLYDGIPANNIRPQNLTFYAPLIRDLNTVVGAYTLSPESGTTATSLPVSGITFFSPNYVFHPQTGITETHPRRFG